MYVIPKKDFLISARISLAEQLGAPEGTCYIELREPSTYAFTRLQAVLAKEDTEENVRAFAELLPAVILDHDLYAEPDGGDARKLTAEEVVQKLLERSDLMFFVIAEYTSKVLFSRGKKIAGT